MNLERLKVYPPEGGEAVTISPDQLDLFESRGWTKTPPKSELNIAQTKSRGDK